MWKKLELERKLILLAVAVFIALAWPVQRTFVARLRTTIEQSVDPGLDSLLRAQARALPDSARGPVVASLERNRQWRAMIPIIVREQQAAILVFTVLLFLGLVIAAWWVLRTLTRPLRQLADAAARIGHGETVEIPDRAGGALGTLEKNMAAMQNELAVFREQARVRGMEQAWRDIARVMAHEIKNPLTPIRLTIDRIQEKQELGTRISDEDLGTGLDRIQTQVEHLEQLVNAFRSFAREPEADPRPLRLHEALHEAAAAMQEQLRTDVTGEATVMGDKLLMNQVFLNLWKNAWEADADRVRAAIAVNGGSAVLTVRDNGRGIPADRVARVWVPYVTYKKGGTGLGLPVVKRIIESLKGTVTVMSNTDGENHGTTFTITLPLA